MTGFLYIDYQDGDQSTYKGIEVCTDNNMLKRFDYGNIMIDFIDYMHWVIEQEELTSVVYSSSFDHFLIDGDQYTSLIINHDTNEVASNTDKMSFSELNKLVTYPVHINIETFEELKIYYRSIRPKQTI